MVRNEGRAPENSNRSHTGRELSPWLKERLLEGKLHSARMNAAMVGLAERSDRMLRRVMNPRRLTSRISSSITVSRPFVVPNRENALLPPGWQAMTLLLSHPSGNLSGYDNPADDRRGSTAQHDIGRSARQVNKAVKQPQPIQRAVTSIAAQPLSRPAGTRIIKRKIEEATDHDRRPSGNVSQSGGEQTKLKTSENDKFENGLITGVSSRAAEEDREITTGEEYPSPEFTPGTTAGIVQTSYPDVGRAAGKTGDTAEMRSQLTDIGSRPVEKIRSDSSPKGDNRREPLLSRKTISASLKQMLAGITHRHPSSPPAKSGRTPPSDSRMKDEGSGTGNTLELPGEHNAEIFAPEIVEEKPAGFRSSADKGTPENIEKTPVIGISPFPGWEVTVNPGPVLPEAEDRPSGGSHITGERLSPGNDERNYASGTVDADAPAKEIKMTSGQHPLESRYISKKLDDIAGKEDVKPGSFRSFKPDASGEINRLGDENAALSSEMPSSVSISALPGVVHPDAPDLTSRIIRPEYSSSESSSEQPAGNLNVHSIQAAGEIKQEHPSSDRRDITSDKADKALNTHPALNMPDSLAAADPAVKIRGYSGPARNTMLQRHTDLVSYQHPESRPGYEFSGIRRKPGTGMVNIFNSGPDDSSKIDLNRRNRVVSGNQHSVPAGSHTANQVIQSRSPSQSAIGLSGPSIGSPVYRSMDMPVRHPMEPAPALGGNYQVDNTPPVPGFNFNAPPPLDLPVAASLRTKADSGESVDARVFRSSSDMSLPAKTGYYFNPQPNITYVNRSAGTESQVQSSGVTDLIRHFNQMGAAGAGSIIQSDVTQQTENGAIDLKALARDIYPYIKRIIMIEKERLPNL